MNGLRQLALGGATPQLSSSLLDVLTTNLCQTIKIPTIFPQQIGNMYNSQLPVVFNVAQQTPRLNTLPRQAHPRPGPPFPFNLIQARQYDASGATALRNCCEVLEGICKGLVERIAKLERSLVPAPTPIPAPHFRPVGQQSP